MFSRLRKSRENEQQTRDELDLMAKAIDDVEGDEFLRRNNLGLGNYSDDEMWQQIESYKHGLYGEAAFSRLISDMAIEKTKREMAREEWENLDKDKQQEADRARFIMRRKEELWDDIGATSSEVGNHQDRRRVELEKKAEKVEQYLGSVPDWTPPHWRMLLARHESSRSRGARLVDNLFDRVDEVHGDLNTADLLGGSN